MKIKFEIPEQTLRLPLENDKGFIEFTRTENSSEPLSLSEDERMFLARGGYGHGSADRTSMRLKGSTLWTLELMKRSAKRDEIDGFKTYGSIIEYFLPRFDNLSLFNDEKEISIDVSSANFLFKKNLLKAYYYEGNVEEFFLPSATYHPNYIFRLMLLAILDDELLDDFERELIQFILNEPRYNQNPYEAEFKDVQRYLRDENSSLIFDNIFFDFGMNSNEKEIKEFLTNFDRSIGKTDINPKSISPHVNYLKTFSLDDLNSKELSEFNDAIEKGAKAEDLVDQIIEKKLEEHYEFNCFGSPDHWHLSCIAEASKKIGRYRILSD